MLVPRSEDQLNSEVGLVGEENCVFIKISQILHCNICGLTIVSREFRALLTVAKYHRNGMN